MLGLKSRSCKAELQLHSLQQNQTKNGDTEQKASERFC